MSEEFDKDGLGVARGCYNVVLALALIVCIVAAGYSIYKRVVYAHHMPSCYSDNRPC